MIAGWISIHQMSYAQFSYLIQISKSSFQIVNFFFRLLTYNMKTHMRYCCRSSIEICSASIFSSIVSLYLVYYKSSWFLISPKKCSASKNIFIRPVSRLCVWLASCIISIKNNNFNELRWNRNFIDMIWKEHAMSWHLRVDWNSWIVSEE